MSVKVMTWVWEHSPVGGTERLVLLALADSADDTGANAWPSVATLARKTRVDERTVQRIIRRLEEAGHLVVEATSGGRRSNRYTVVMHAPEPVEPAAADPRQDATPGRMPPRHDAGAPPAQTPPQPRHSYATRTSFTRPVSVPPRAGAPSGAPPRSTDAPAPSVDTNRSGWCPRHGGYLGRCQRCASRTSPPRGAALPTDPRAGQCPKHRGSPAHNCGPCRAERLAEEVA